MPHIITLTGSAIGRLREYDRYVSFDMLKKGAPFASPEAQKNNELTKQEETVPYPYHSFSHDF